MDESAVRGAVVRGRPYPRTQDNLLWSASLKLRKDILIIAGNWESFQSEDLPLGHKAIIESTTSGSLKRTTGEALARKAARLLPPGRNLLGCLAPGRAPAFALGP